jgi:hypothetical protein
VPRLQMPEDVRSKAALEQLQEDWRHNALEVAFRRTAILQSRTTTADSTTTETAGDDRQHKSYSVHEDKAMLFRAPQHRSCNFSVPFQHLAQPGWHTQHDALVYSSSKLH